MSNKLNEKEQGMINNIRELLPRISDKVLNELKNVIDYELQKRKFEK